MLVAVGVNTQPDGTWPSPSTEAGYARLLRWAEGRGGPSAGVARGLRRGKDGSLAGEDAPVFASRKRNTPRGGHLAPSRANRTAKRAAKKAGLSGDGSPHGLRHSHATHAERRRADLDLIMRTLRHASLSTTGRYLHADPTDSSAVYLRP